jgi:hypothetical protein
MCSCTCKALTLPVPVVFPWIRLFFKKKYLIIKYKIIKLVGAQAYKFDELT